MNQKPTVKEIQEEILILLSELDRVSMVYMYTFVVTNMDSSPGYVSYQVLLQ